MATVGIPPIVSQPTDGSQPPDIQPTQAVGDVQVTQSPSTQFAQAVDNQDLNSLKQQATQGFDTPQGQVAAHAYGVIKDGADKLDALTMPVIEAKTPQDKNIAAADALKTVKDYPQWGTALISYLMGDKKTALNLVTGGQPITQVKYGQSGKQYQYTTNQLGQVMGITDRNGNPVSPADYEADGGGIDRVNDTFSYLNNKKIGEVNTLSLANGLKGANATTAATNAVAPIAKQAFDLVSTLPNLSPEKTALISGILTQSTSKETGKTASKSGLEQTTEGVTTGKEAGTKLNIGGGVGPVVPEGGTGGTGVNVGGTKTSGNTEGTSANVMKMGSNAGGTTATNATNTSAGQNEIARAAFLKDVPEGDQQKYIQVWDAANSIARANAQLETNGQRIPSFITPQSPTNVVEGTPAIQIRLLKPMMNQELNAAFNQFYQQNIGTHIKNGNPPSMEEMEAAFTNTKGPGSYGEIVDKYTKQAGQIIKQSGTSVGIKSATYDNPEDTSQPAPKPKPKQAVAPPAENKPARKPLSAIFGAQ